MKNQTFISNNKLTAKTTAFLTMLSVLFSVLTPFSTVRAADWYDSGWILVGDSRFHADNISNDCPSIGPIAILIANWGTGAWHAWVNLNAPAGNYSIDMKLAYTHKSTSPPQSDETIRLYTKAGLTNTIPPTTYTDVADVPDMGDYISDNCDDLAAAIKTYADAVSRTMQFPADGDIFLQGTGSSVRVIAIRVYGYKEEPSAPLLIINKSIDKTHAVPGDEVVYTVNYVNIGDAATGVIVKDTFNYVNQQYITFVSATPSPSSGTDTWNIGTLNAGQSGQIIIRARVKDDVPPGTTEVKNRASIQSNELLLVYSNCANFFITVSGTPSLNISKSVDKSSASPGDEIVYTINYSNTGDGGASNVVVTDPFNNLNQEYLTFVSATPSPTSGTDTWNIGALDAGQSGQIIIKAKISTSTPPGTTEIKDRATIDSNETNLQYSNYVSTYVTGNIILTVSKLGRNITNGTSWAEITEAKPSHRLAFSLTITATGTGTAPNVMVSDSLPYKINYVAGSTTIDGVAAPDGITDTGINIGNILAGQSKTVIFEVDVANETQFPFGKTTLFNLAYTWVNPINKSSDSAKVVVTRDLPLPPCLVVTKSVDKSSAFPGDEIIYTINYSNTSGSSASNVVITDPFNNLNQYYLTFISSTPPPVYGHTWNIGTLNVGQSGQIIIKAKISTSTPPGTTEIKDRATIDSNETNLQYSNYVSTYVSGNADLSITKLVRNVSGGGEFSDSISAKPSDEIEFSLAIHSAGSTSAINVKVWDTLPSRLTYISGSTTVDGSPYSDGITIGGIYIGDLTPGQTKTVKFRARAAGESMFNVGVTTLTNYGYTNASGVSSVYDIATVEVTKESGCSPSLSINKQIRNVTQGFGYWTDFAFANPGDEIEVLIKINSVGTETAQNSKVRDQLPVKLNYISGSTTINGAYKEDGITYSNGISLGNLYVGDSREIRFKFRVASAYEFSASSTTLTNYAYAWGDKTCGEISDSAQITVNKQETQSYGLSISKLGRNISRGQADLLDSFLASPSEEVEFSIQLINVGNTDLSNVRVWDTLPVNISIISNSTTIDGVSWGGDIIGAGLSLGILNKGQTKTIKFRANVGSADKFGAGSTTLINTVYATATNISQISDSASVIIYQPGAVLGAGLVKTGADSIGLSVLMIISCFITFFVYCHIREQRLSDILNSGKGNRFYRWLIKLYFRIKFLLTVKIIRFKKVYW